MRDNDEPHHGRQMGPLIAGCGGLAEELLYLNNLRQKLEEARTDEEQARIQGLIDTALAARQPRGNS